MTTEAVAQSSIAAEVSRALKASRPEAGDRLDEVTRYALLSPGKLLRPLLLLTSAEAVGGRREDVLPAAVAVEHLHVASLVHDDIIDGDDLRRGRASVQARYGVADAIIAGDALIFALFGIAADCAAPDAAIVAAMRVLAQAGEDLCRGQMREALLVPPRPGDPGSGLDAYLGVAALKTGALFRGVCRAGAVLGGGSSAEVDILTRFAEHVGIAFQMYDDLLAFVADPGNTGKPATSDAANLRATYPVLLAHRAGTAAERTTIERALSGEWSPEVAHAALRDAVYATEAVELAFEGIREEARSAKTGLEDLTGAEAAVELAAIADLAVNRTR